MSIDFWAGYISGAAGIVIGNPLDLIKTRLQAGSNEQPATVVSGVRGPDARSPSSLQATPAVRTSFKAHFDTAGTLVRGAAAPILGYGALNALLYVSYNRSLAFLTSQPYPPPTILDPAGPQPFFPPLWKIWAAGAIAGLATFVVSAPTELIKCRAQVSTSHNVSSWSIARDIWKQGGLRGLYFGGGVTSVRDAVGYGFYFWAYEGLRNGWARKEDTDRDTAFKVLVCGGVAGVVTWASIFPLDVVKTRLQTQSLNPSITSTPIVPTVVVAEGSPLIANSSSTPRPLSAITIAKQAYRAEGVGVFFRGLGIVDHIDATRHIPHLIPGFRFAFDHGHMLSRYYPSLSISIEFPFTTYIATLVTHE